MLIAAVCLLTGCGPSAPAAAPNPVAEELSYFAPGASFVMTVATNPSSATFRNLEALQSPASAFGASAAVGELSRLGINYNTTIRPLLGNPIVFGLEPQPGGQHVGSQALLVWTTRDAYALGALVKRLHLVRTQTDDGASLYTLPTATLAVKGATVLVGRSAQEVVSALARHGREGGISTADFDQALAGLPQGSLVEAFGDLKALLSGMRASGARRVPWVAALREYAVTFGAGSSGLRLQYKIDTADGTLTPTQLPIAIGTTAPSLAGSLPIQVGIRDPAQLVTFIEAAERVADPAGWSAFLARQDLLRHETGVDLSGLLGLLTSDLMIDSDGHTTMARAGVSSSARAKRILAKLATQPRGLLTGATAVTRVPGGFYLVRRAAARPIAVGVTNGQLVAGNAGPAELRMFAAAPAAPLAGAQGSAAFRIAVPDLLQLALKQSPSRLITTVADDLGDLTGWATASPTGLTGGATLAIK